MFSTFSVQKRIDCSTKTFPIIIRCQTEWFHISAPIHVQAAQEKIVNVSLLLFLGMYSMVGAKSAEFPTSGCMLGLRGKQAITF